MTPAAARRLATGLLACLLLAGVAASVAPAGDPIVISQRGRRFSPNTVVITEGTVVRIVNDDRVTHHVYIENAGMNFDSGELPVGATVDLRFDRPGSFLVRCAIHPIMRLNVAVER